MALQIEMENIVKADLLRNGFDESYILKIGVHEIHANYWILYADIKGVGLPRFKIDTQTKKTIQILPTD